MNVPPSTLNELLTLYPPFKSCGLSWDQFGSATEEDMRGLKAQWFPNDFVPRIALQDIWLRHPRKLPATSTPDGQYQQTMARLLLLDRSEYEDDLSRLLDLVEQARLPGIKSCILSHYRLGKRVRDSDAYALTIDNLSTVATKDHYDMSTFDLSMLHGSSKLKVEVVKLNRKKLTTFLSQELFNNSIGALQMCLEQLIPVVVSVRKHFIFLREKKFGYTEPGYFQPIFTLLLEMVARKINKSTCNKTGAAFPFSIEVDVETDSGNEETVTVTGKSDIVKVETLECDSFDAIQFLVELKVPFGTLFHATSDGPKGQLLCQLLALWEMSEGNRVGAIGALTDLFAVFICGSYSEDKRQFYITQSVVDAEDYILHLLLLFCTDCDLRDLSDNNDPAQLGVKRHRRDDTNAGDSNNTGAGKNGGPILRSASQAASKPSRTVNTTKPSGSSNSKASKRCTYADDCAVSCAAEGELQKWYAQHNGFVYLNKENLSNI